MNKNGVTAETGGMGGGEKRKSPLGDVSGFSLPAFYHRKLVKSSPSPHKLAGRFISRLTFSPEMPPGTWASALWREMTGLLLGAAAEQSKGILLPCPLRPLSIANPLAPPPTSLPSLSSYGAFQMSGDSPA